MATKCGKNRSKPRSVLGVLVLTTILVWVVTGCQGETPTSIAAVQPPTISEPKVDAPTPLEPGKEAGISVEVSRATGVTLAYTWEVDSGEIVRGQGSPAITYRAPDEPGVYNVRVAVEWDGQSVEKATSIEVQVKGPTPTPTSALPTDTPPQPLTATPTTSPDVTPTLMPDTVTLIYPQDSQSVPCENLAKGMYSSDITNPIWPVVYIGGRFHPQDEGGRPPPMVNGIWYGTVRFGDCTMPPDHDRGNAFQLIIVTADEQVNRAFEDYLSDARLLNWPGMESLPEGVKEYVRIVVTRQ